MTHLDKVIWEHQKLLMILVVVLGLICFVSANQIIDISNQVASAHTYNLAKYNCKSFSQDLVKELNQNNITSYCVFGKYYPTGNKHSIGVHYELHDWVEINNSVDIEATQGYVIPDDIYQNYYTVIKKGVCL